MSSGEHPPPRGVPRPLSGGPTKFGPFWLDARLAVGGTAEVYVARPLDAHAQPRRLIVKRLLPHFVSDAEGRTMFEREAALHAAVRHDNVVKVYASGVEGDEPWLAMELVDGCDLYRLLRRLAAEGRKLPASVAIHVACEVLSALDSVHGARDVHGQPMGIVHRDVTPSNVYLSVEGRVKLGDFGIARSLSRATMRSSGGAMLKGKFAYLSPEQVAGEPFDHRADLFAISVVTAEMLLGKPLFAGSGQLAVLLAIRDCRIDPLREIRRSLPDGLFPTLERALARDPAARFPSAAALHEALVPYDSSPAGAKAELSALVRWIQSAPSVEQMPGASSGRMSAAPAVPPPREEEALPDSQAVTGQYDPLSSRVVTQAGEQLGPWTFARLVEAIATAQVGRGDQVDYLGRGMAPIETIPELERFLPAKTATTNRLGSVGAADFTEEVSPAALLTILLRIVANGSSGVLFAEGPTESRRGSRPPPAPQGETQYETGGRKELYFVDGRLHHVSSTNASELLGQSLVRRGAVSRDELDFALAVLPRYGGRMGDTLISLGLVSSLEVFRAIRDQGRDRLIDLFQWSSGRVSFYAGQAAPTVDFPLDLDVLPLLFAGMEAAEPGAAPLEQWRSRFDAQVARAPSPPAKLAAAPWPAPAADLLAALGKPRKVRDALSIASGGGTANANDLLRALEILAAGGLVMVS